MPHKLRPPVSNPFRNRDVIAITIKGVDAKDGATREEEQGHETMVAIALLLLYIFTEPSGSSPLVRLSLQ